MMLTAIAARPMEPGHSMTAHNGRETKVDRSNISPGNPSVYPICAKRALAIASGNRPQITVAFSVCRMEGKARPSRNRTAAWHPKIMPTAAPDVQSGGRRPTGMKKKEHTAGKTAIHAEYRKPGLHGACPCATLFLRGVTQWARVRIKQA